MQIKDTKRAGEPLVTLQPFGATRPLAACNGPLLG